MRARLADLLVRLAYRIDPNRPAAQTADGGGWIVSLGGVPLGRVTVDQGSVRGAK